MNFENPINTTEKEKKPEKLYRAYTLNPEDLSIGKFQETLIPMNINKEDPTKVNDGNELGVYMSTNENMVRAAYSDGGFAKYLHIQTPLYNDGYAKVKSIKLPSCGIIIEIDTKSLPIRRPQINLYLKGVYNNGFEGDEWIADSIPASNYAVKKLILNTGSSSLDKIEIMVDGSDKEKLQEAITLIKIEFEKIKKQALKYKEFLESISEKERLSNKFILEEKWKKYLEKT